MPRYKLTLEYHGAPYCGWQRQDNGYGVQQALEEAVRQLDPSVEKITAAGRTDAGVHAIGQVAHLDLVRAWEGFDLAKAINHFLRRERVVVIDAALVAEDFHARFDARARHYRYRIIQRRAPLAVQDGLAWHLKAPLDIDAMREGAAHLVGHHDFTTFRSVNCQAKSPVKTLDFIGIERSGEHIDIVLRARSFLHNQVRSIAGTLERVGKGVWTPDRVAEARDAKDRAACGPVAPACGLYLERVIYDDVPTGQGTVSDGMSDSGAK
jgi:tRNA pseudouridine38-40 synthase